MKTFKQNLLWVSLTAVALTGCGSSSDDHNDHEDHDHEHEFSILVSQANTTTLSLLEEGELEALDDAAAGNGASLVLSKTGAYSAVLANGTVNFVHGLHEDHDEEEEDHEESEEEHEEEEHGHEEAHVLEFSLTGSQVIATGGSFAVLNGGSTTLVFYDELEKETPATVNTSSLSITETYPTLLLLLDEDHELVMVFDGTDAFVNEGTTLETLFACANPSSHAQGHELIAVACDEGVSVLVVEGGEAEHIETYTDTELDGTAANYVWRAMGDVIVGFEAGTTNYAVIEHDETTEEVVVIQGSDTGTFAFDANICDIQLDTHSSDILAITAAGQFVALDHEAQSIRSITLDESAQSTCDDFVLAAAAKAAVVVDNAAQIVFEIDVDDIESNPNGYHVHGRETLTVNDIASMVIFHEVEAQDHAH